MSNGYSEKNGSFRVILCVCIYIYRKRDLYLIITIIHRLFFRFAQRILFTLMHKSRQNIFFSSFCRLGLLSVWILLQPQFVSFFTLPNQCLAFFFAFFSTVGSLFLESFSFLLHLVIFFRSFLYFLLLSFSYSSLTCFTRLVVRLRYSSLDFFFVKCEV